MKKFQGKHNVNPAILQATVDIILLDMEFHNLTSSAITKDQMYMFLIERKLSNHYDDINIIYHIITDYPCPEFSHLESELLELFEQQEKALEEVMNDNKNDGRVNSINVYYKLCKLLQRVGYPCKKSDFYILKTKAKEDEHDEIMKKAWIKLGWKWVET